MLGALLERYRGEGGAVLLQRSGSGIIRRLCMHLGGRAVFRELAGVLAGERDLAFAAMLVQALNLILLTGPEVSHAMPWGGRGQEARG